MNLVYERKRVSCYQQQLMVVDANGYKLDFYHLLSTVQVRVHQCGMELEGC